MKVNEMISLALLTTHCAGLGEDPMFPLSDASYMIIASEQSPRGPKVSDCSTSPPVVRSLLNLMKCCLHAQQDQSDFMVSVPCHITISPLTTRADFRFRTLTARRDVIFYDAFILQKILHHRMGQMGFQGVFVELKRYLLN